MPRVANLQTWRVQYLPFKQQVAFYKAQATLEDGGEIELPAPAWLKKVKAEVAKSLPTTLPEGRSEFVSSTMTQPELKGKFRKYAFTCQTKGGQTINLSVSPTLLTRILEVVEAGKDFAITKQGQGINTDYVVGEV